jgi:hypothetical protein
MARPKQQPQNTSPDTARKAAEKLGADLHQPRVEEYPITLATPQQSLPVKLTQEEIIMKCQDLAKTIQDIRHEEEDQANEKTAMKARLSSLNDHLQKLAEIVDKRTEERTVDCIVRAQEDGTLTVTRLDTGEVIESRPINERERQLALKHLAPPKEAEKSEAEKTDAEDKHFDKKEPW